MIHLGRFPVTALLPREKMLLGTAAMLSALLSLVRLGMKVVVRRDSETRKSEDQGGHG